MTEMIRVRIHVGCPTGTTEDWSKSTEIFVHEDLVEYLSANIIDSALVYGKAIE